MKSLTSITPLPKIGGLPSNIRPANVARNVEANETVVGIYIFSGAAQLLQFILEDIGEALEENERKDIILEFGSIYRPPDDTGSFPQPVFQCAELKFGITVGH